MSDYLKYCTSTLHVGSCRIRTGERSYNDTRTCLVPFLFSNNYKTRKYARNTVCAACFTKAERMQKKSESEAKKTECIQPAFPGESRGRVRMTTQKKKEKNLLTKELVKQFKLEGEIPNEKSQCANPWHVPPSILMLMYSNMHCMEDDCPGNGKSQHVLTDQSKANEFTLHCKSCFHQFVVQRSVVEGGQKIICATDKLSYTESEMLYLVSVLQSGGGYSSECKKYTVTGHKMPLSKRKFYALSAHFWETIENLAERCYIKEAERLKNDSFITICSDGAWSKRGWHARHGCYVTLEFYSSRVIMMYVMNRNREYTNPRTGLSHEVFRGNFSNALSSRLMEGTGLENLLQYLDDSKLLPKVNTIVMDRDLAANKLLREWFDGKKTQHISIKYDPGHIKKGLFRKLNQIFTGRFVGFVGRISSWFMRCVKRAEEETKMVRSKSSREKKLTSLFLKYFDKWSDHYTRASCEGDETCPCHEMKRSVIVTTNKIIVSEEKKDDIEDFIAEDDVVSDVTLLLEIEDLRIETEKEVKAIQEEENNIKKAEIEEVKVKRKFLDVSNKTDKIKLLELNNVMNDIRSRTDEYCHGYNTCNVEAFHVGKTIYAPKHKEYWKSFSGRACLSVLNRNMSHLELMTALFNDLRVTITSTMIESWKSADNLAEMRRELNKNTEYRIKSAKRRKYSHIKNKISARKCVGDKRKYGKSDEEETSRTKKQKLN